MDREGVFNQWILPNGPMHPRATQNWYAYNRGQGIKVDKNFAALERHEGMGTLDKPGSGHTQMLKHYINEWRDPRHEIESHVSSSRDDLQRENDKTINEINSELTKYGADPLPVTGTFSSNYSVWDLEKKKWNPVPGPYLF